jgi:hypothetical protein
MTLTTAATTTTLHPSIKNDPLYFGHCTNISTSVCYRCVFSIFYTKYIHTYIHTYKGVLCLAESGAGKTQFVKLLLSKVHSGR